MVSAHDDYITSLACSVSAGVLVSAGLRGGLVRWDLERLMASSLSQVRERVGAVYLTPARMCGLSSMEISIAV